MLEAMFGWSDGNTSKIYTRNAERARLARATVARINWDGIGSKLLAQDESTGDENGNEQPHLPESVADGEIPAAKLRSNIK